MADQFENRPRVENKLGDAFKTLQDAVNSREAGRKSPEDFMDLGGHSTEEIRGAVITVFDHLAKTQGAESAGRTSTLRKKVPGGTFVLEMFYEDTEHQFPRQIELRTDGTVGDRVIEMMMPLADTGDRGNGFYVNEASFTDKQSNKVKHSYLPEQAEMNPKDAKFVLRGARTLMANLLSWDEPEITYPEDLDRKLIA